MRPKQNTQTILLSILFLFFLQALSDFIEAIYAFGLLVTAFTLEVAAIILFFTPLLLLLFRKPPSRSILLGLASLAILARLLAPILHPGGKLVASGVSVGAFMMFFPALLQNRRSVEGWKIGNGLALALSLSVLFRTANSSLDLSESGSFQWIGWLLGIVAAILLWRTELVSPQGVSLTRARRGRQITGLSIGFVSVILIIYFTFAGPTIIARWTSISYAAVLFILVIVLSIFGWLWNSGYVSARLTKSRLATWNLLFVLFLVLAILPHQIAFPSNADAYPLDAPAASPLRSVFLVFMLLLSPVLFIDFMLFARQISFENPSLPQIARSFAVAALFFLMMVFFHVFTSIYDYAPIIGPMFRDRFWLVYFLAGLGVAFPVFLLSEELLSQGKPDVVDRLAPLMVGVLAVVSLLAILYKQC